MNGFQYQKEAERTMGLHTEMQERLLNSSLGLIGETGEIADIIKKHLFHGHELGRTELIKELGDVQWYIAQACAAFGTSVGIIERGIFTFLPTTDALSADAHFNNELVTRILKITLEATQFGAHINQWLFSGQSTRTLDGDRVKGHLVRIQTILVEFCILLDTTIENVRRMNIEKLEKRYGPGGFSYKESINRAE